MNQYIAIYKNKRLDINAEDVYLAQLKAKELFNAKHSWHITMIRMDNDKIVVLHHPERLIVRYTI